MKVLYIFPHPDDESFGPAAAISRHKRQGHNVYLLTLTHGEAIKQPFKFNYTKEKMGEIRVRELQAVANVLKLDQHWILDFADGGLKEIDPILLEKSIIQYILDVKPDVLVTYPVHGISGLPDHLVTHALVKRVFSYLKSQGKNDVNRLAFVTLNKGSIESHNSNSRLHHSLEEDIDCIMQVSKQDTIKMKECLNCFANYQQIINKPGAWENVTPEVFFEFYNEDFTPPLHDLFDQLPGKK